MAQINYDVFISFKGEGTLLSLIRHLHRSLEGKGIRSFMHNNLKDEISPSVFEAIKQSKISVIVFSEDYVSSRRCLEELIKILECRNRETNRLIVIPFFFDITPADVRNQTGSLAKAFAEHEKRFKKSLDQVQKWKVALEEAANISGSYSRFDKSMDQVMRDIVKDVKKKLDGSSQTVS